MWGFETQVYKCCQVLTSVLQYSNRRILLAGISTRFAIGLFRSCSVTLVHLVRKVATHRAKVFSVKHGRELFGGVEWAL